MESAKIVPKSSKDMTKVEAAADYLVAMTPLGALGSPTTRIKVKISCQELSPYYRWHSIRRQCRDNPH